MIAARYNATHGEGFCSQPAGGYIIAAALAVHASTLHPVRWRELIESPLLRWTARLRMNRCGCLATAVWSGDPETWFTWTSFHQCVSPASAEHFTKAQLTTAECLAHLDAL